MANNMHLLFKRGQHKRIFQSPLTEEDYEGVAELRHPARGDRYEITEDWWVRFPGESRDVYRTIRRPKGAV